MLDKISKKILMELQSDGRISNVELAARVNLSPAACLERVRKLHESGYIMGYTAQLNPQLLDVSLLVFIEVVLDRTTPEVFDAFKHSVQIIPEVLECHMVAGGFDYLVKARQGHGRLPRIPGQDAVAERCAGNPHLCRHGRGQKHHEIAN